MFWGLFPPILNAKYARSQGVLIQSDYFNQDSAWDFLET